MKRIKLSTKPKLIKNKDINTIDFKLIFPIKQNNDNLYYIKLLNLFFVTSSKKYPDQREFRKTKLKNTILELDFFSRTIVDNTYLVFSFSTPKEGLIKNFSIDRAFKFAIDILLNPNAQDGEFNLDKFNYEKEFLVNNHLRSKDGIYASNSQIFYDEIDKEGYLGNSYDENTKLLESIDNKKLYDFYKKNILENTFVSYVFGNITNKKVNELFNKYIPQEKESISFNINYFKPLPMQKRSYKEIITNYNQSELFLEYQCDMKEKDKDKLSMIFNILNASENNLIFEALRVKNNLVYDVRMHSFLSNAMFVIDAFIPSDKYKETKKIIDDVFKSLKNKKFLQECINRLLKGLEVDLLKEEDSLSKDLNKAIDKDAKLKGTSDIIASYRKIKIDELIEFISQIKLTNEMLFRGDNND